MLSLSQSKILLLLAWNPWIIFINAKSHKEAWVWKLWCAPWAVCVNWFSCSVHAEWVKHRYHGAFHVQNTGSLSGRLRWMSVFLYITYWNCCVSWRKLEFVTFIQELLLNWNENTIAKRFYNDKIEKSIRKLQISEQYWSYKWNH